MEDWEVIIIGGGPSGLTAGIYATRSGLKTLLLEKSSLGGQVITTEHIENYPGFYEPIVGAELIDRIRKQAEGFGLRIKEFCEVADIRSHSNHDRFTVESSNTERFKAGALVIATGAQPRDLDAPGASRLKYRGISYCATCDGPLFRGKPVLVVGGGNSAIEEALYLTRFASKVYIAHRRDTLRADHILGQRALKEPKIEMLWNSIVHEVVGKEQVTRVVIEDVKTKELTGIEVSGIFVYIGITPNTKLLEGLAGLDDQGYIITNPQMETSHPGIFAAGDCRQKKLRQIVTGVSDGATAAMMAYHYLQNTRGGIN